MLKDVRSRELHDRRPIGFDRQGAEGSESREESGSMESRVSQSTGLVFGSTAVGITAPKEASNHPSSIGVVGSELMVGANVGAASRALFGGRARSCSS